MQKNNLHHLLITFILLPLLFIGCHSNSSISPPFIQSPATIINDIGNMTVAIMIRGEFSFDPSRPLCTGVFVKEDVILTAGHCIDHFVDEQPLAEGLKNVNIYWMTQGEVVNFQEEPNALYLGHPIANDKEKDLGLIKIGGGNLPRHRVAKMAEINPSIGERLHSVGHVGGLYWSHANCYVSGYRDKMLGSQGPFIQVEGAINKGNSGGGIFNERGEVVGIVSFTYSKAPGMSFGVGLDNIKKFLFENLN